MKDYDYEIKLLKQKINILIAEKTILDLKIEKEKDNIERLKIGKKIAPKF